MDAFATWLYFGIIAVECVGFWALIARIPRNDGTPYAVWCLSLSSAFAAVAWFTAFILYKVFESSVSGGDLGLSALLIFCVLGSLVFTPFMIAVGAVRMIYLGRKRKIR